MGLYDNLKKKITKTAKAEGRPLPGTLAHNMSAKKTLEQKVKKNPPKARG